MNRSRTIRSRAGFTLVEMLMAVTLVLIMMVMFAEVFQIAGGAVTKQRTLADNDQNARTFATIMRADLDKRTFRTLLPFYPGEPSNSATSFNNRRGYFYISANNPADGSDDVLQFTVMSMSTVSLRIADESSYFGKAVQLPAPGSGNLTQQFYNFLQNSNQPDRDDGQVISNGAASSRAAEVSYFMRGGRLYRRVMLLRDPIPDPGVPSHLANDPQPKASNGQGYFSTVGGYSGNFWSDFDFSAYRTPTGLNVVGGTPISARFVGLDFLNNLSDPVFPLTAIDTYRYSLGQTWNRFGFNSEFSLNSPFNGLPREFSGTNSSAAGFFFLGRFTQEETSSAAFQYPQSLSPVVSNGNPMDAAPLGNVLRDSEDVNGNGVLDAGEDTNGNGVLDFADGVVDGYAGGARAGVDLLLSNVHEFRVELWDERVGDFVPAGHTTGVGDFHSARQLNPAYHPQGRPAGLTNIFDTWSPNFDRNLDNNQLNDPPPYRPLTYDPTSGLPGANPAAGAGPSPPGPTLYWTPGQAYNPGDVVFPSVEDINGNRILDPGEDGLFGFPADGLLNTRRDEDAPPFGNGDNVFQLAEDSNGNGTRDRTTLPFEPFGSTLCFRCVRTGTASNDPYLEPQWTTTPGRIVSGNEDLNGNGVLDPGEDIIIPNGVLDLGPDWICEYNARPLRAIRITVRFEHPTSQQMKQVTIVHSLRDTTAVP